MFAQYTLLRAKLMAAPNPKRKKLTSSAVRYWIPRSNTYDTTTKGYGGVQTRITYADNCINSAMIRVFALPNLPRIVFVKKAAEMKPMALLTNTRDMMEYEMW